MLRLSFLRRSEVLCAGIDLEGGRAVLVKGGPEGLEVVAEAEVALRPDLGDTVLALLEELGVPNAPVVLGLAGEGVMVKSLRLPGDIKPSGIPDAVRWQFMDTLEGFLVRFAMLGKAPDGQHEVLAAAVPEDLVKEKAAPLVNAGVRLLAADLRVCALWRAAKKITDSEGKALAAVEVSHSGARIACGRERLEFAREITGENLEFEIRRTLGYYQSQYDTGEVTVVRFGSPGESGDARFAAALGLALYPFVEPKLDFLPKKMRKARRVSSGAVIPRRLKVWAAAVGVAFVLATPYIYAAACGAQVRSLEREISALAPKVAEVQKIRTERMKLEEWVGIVESFSPAPLVPVLEDTRYAVPHQVWLTELELVPEQNTRSADKQKISQGQTEFEAGQAQESELPPKPSVLHLEGFSKDAASVGLFRDNLVALPWCAGVEALKVEYDDNIEAYCFELIARFKGGEVGG